MHLETNVLVGYLRFSVFAAIAVSRAVQQRGAVLFNVAGLVCVAVVLLGEVVENVTVLYELLPYPPEASPTGYEGPHWTARNRACARSEAVNCAAFAW